MWYENCSYSISSSLDSTFEVGGIQNPQMDVIQMVYRYPCIHLNALFFLRASFLFGAGRLSFCPSQLEQAIKYYSQGNTRTISRSQFSTKMAIARLSLWMDIELSLIWWTELGKEVSVSEFSTPCLAHHLLFLSGRNWFKFINLFVWSGYVFLGEWKWWWWWWWEGPNHVEAKKEKE